MHFSHKNCLPNDKLFELSIINLKQNKQKEQQVTLEVLHLEDRSICVININSFNQFENLRELNLSSNKLGALKKETFNNLKTLEILRLEDCSIKSIEADAFVKLKNLMLPSMRGKPGELVLIPIDFGYTVSPLTLSFSAAILESFLIGLAQIDIHLVQRKRALLVTAVSMIFYKVVL